MLDSDDVLPMKGECGLQIFLLDESSETLQNLKKEDTATVWEYKNGQEPQDQNVAGSIPAGGALAMGFAWASAQR